MAYWLPAMAGPEDPTPGRDRPGCDLERVWVAAHRVKEAGTNVAGYTLGMHRGWNLRSTSRIKVCDDWPTGERQLRSTAKTGRCTNSGLAHERMPDQIGGRARTLGRSLMEHVDIIRNDWEKAVQRRVATITAIPGGGVVVECVEDLRTKRDLTRLVSGASSVNEAAAAVTKGSPWVASRSHGHQNCRFLAGPVRPMKKRNLLPAGGEPSGGPDRSQPCDETTALDLAQ